METWDDFEASEDDYEENSLLQTTHVMSDAKWISPRLQYRGNKW